MKLTERKRREIVQRLAAGERRRALAADFGISYHLISRLDPRRAGIFRGLPTPAMQAWIRAGLGEQVLSVWAMRAPPPIPNPPRAAPWSMGVAIYEAATEAERQQLVAAMWYHNPKLARHLTERSALYGAQS
jgi:hypothetical protein